MFFLLKIILIFCCIALVFAAMGDLALFLLIRGTGPVGIKFESVQAFNRIPVIVLSAIWVLAGILGWIIARKLHIIPQL